MSQETKGMHKNTSMWLSCPQKNTRARYRLFCFPYSGGSASIFVPWARALPASIEVWPIQLPGRGARLSEPPFTQMNALVQALFQAILPYLDKPFIFFGHSMGALLSFELARYLRRHAGLLPVHLIASGHRAPQVPDPDPPIHNLPEPAFLDELRRLNGTPEEILHHDELRQLLLPTLRADFTVCETYAYTNDEPLECPISAFGGLQDKDVARYHLEAWQLQTRSTFTVRMFPGDHFFLNTARSLLLQALVRELSHLVVSASPQRVYERP